MSRKRTTKHHTRIYSVVTRKEKTGHKSQNRITSEIVFVRGLHLAARILYLKYVGIQDTTKLSQYLRQLKNKLGIFLKSPTQIRYKNIRQNIDHLTELGIWPKFRGDDTVFEHNFFFLLEFEAYFSSNLNYAYINKNKFHHLFDWVDLVRSILRKPERSLIFYQRKLTSNVKQKRHLIGDEKIETVLLELWKINKLAGGMESKASDDFKDAMQNAYKN